MHIDILAWEEPIRHYSATEWDIGQYKLLLYITLKDAEDFFNADNPTYRTESNQIDSNFYNHLEEFLERASRFCTLKIKDEKLPLGPKTTLRKILLLQDYPPMIFQNLERWHNILLYIGI